HWHAHRFLWRRSCRLRDREAGARGVRRQCHACGRLRHGPAYQDRQQHAALGLYGGQLRGAVLRPGDGRRCPQADRRPAAFQRRQLVARALGPQHRKMGREGYGRRARTRPGRQGRGAAVGSGRSAHERHEPSQDEIPPQLTPGTCIRVSCPRRRAPRNLQITGSRLRGNGTWKLEPETTVSFFKPLIAALLALSLPAAAQPTAKLIPLKIAYDGYSMTTAPMNYAVQTGIFRKYGLDITLVYIDTGTTLSQAVVGGSVNIAQNGYTPAAAAAVQGADVVFIGGISNQLPFQLVVK